MVVLHDMKWIKDYKLVNMFRMMRHKIREDPKLETSDEENFGDFIKDRSPI